MCLICVDFQKNKMTLGDAKRAYSEMVEKIGPEHAKEVKEMLREAEREKAQAENDDQD